MFKMSEIQKSRTNFVNSNERAMRYVIAQSNEARSTSLLSAARIWSAPPRIALKIAMRARYSNY